MRRVLQVLTGALFVVSCGVHLWAQAVVDPFWIDATIWLPVLLLLAWFLCRTRKWDQAAIGMALGLVFSWLGDGVGSISFLIKLALFLVAQICYALGFLGVYRNRWGGGGRSRVRWWWLLYGVVVVVIVAVVAPHTGSLLPAVIGYGVVLGAMALLSTGLGAVGLIGGLFFMVSDGLLAVQEFVGWRFEGQGLVIMATYLVAQALLAHAVASRPAAD